MVRVSRNLPAVCSVLTCGRKKKKNNNLVVKVIFECRVWEYLFGKITNKSHQWFVCIWCLGSKWWRVWFIAWCRVLKSLRVIRLCLFKWIVTREALSVRECFDRMQGDPEEVAVLLMRLWSESESDGYHCREAELFLFDGRKIRERCWACTCSRPPVPDSLDHLPSLRFD